jgi:hypothetical protein
MRNRFEKSEKLADGVPSLGEDSGDFLIFYEGNITNNPTVEDLLHTVAVLRDQLKELKASVYNNKNTVLASRREKEQLKYPET